MDIVSLKLMSTFGEFSQKIWFALVNVDFGSIRIVYICAVDELRQNTPEIQKIFLGEITYFSLRFFGWRTPDGCSC